jgi:hypothetical protein
VRRVVGVCSRAVRRVVGVCSRALRITIAIQAARSQAVCVSRASLVDLRSLISMGHIAFRGAR